MVPLHRNDIALPLPGIEQQVKREPQTRRCSSLKLFDDFRRPAPGDPLLLVQFEDAPCRIVAERQTFMLDCELPKRADNSHAQVSNRCLVFDINIVAHRPHRNRRQIRYFELTNFFLDEVAENSIVPLGAFRVLQKALLMGQIFLDHPSDGAVDKGNVVGLEEINR